MMTGPPDQERNPNEDKWRRDGLTTFGSDRFDRIYRNFSKLRCALRVKYEEMRVIWKRQELNRYKSRYADRGEGNSTLCSYCKREREDEIHIYTECDSTGTFMVLARDWFRGTFGGTPSLMLNGPRLFGLENEAPDDFTQYIFSICTLLYIRRTQEISTAKRKVLCCTYEGRIKAEIQR